MNKSILAFIITIFFISCKDDDSTPIPEKIFEGEVDLISQQEVDDFGSQGYTRIIGNLNIGDDSNPISTIEDLDALSSLRSVESNVRIRKNPKLENIDGLKNLESIEWSLFIHNNDLLKNIQGLSSLTFVANDLAIYENNQLVSLDGLENWNSQTTGLDIFIFTNPLLEDFCALTPILSNVDKAEYDVGGNAFNPTREDILLENCRK